MNITKIKTMATATIMLAGAVACNTAKETSGEIIERPEFKVENGQFVPELLEAFGRVSDPQVSPDGKQILYGVQFESLKENRGNRELWVMNIDGSNHTRLTHTPESEQSAVWIDGGKKIAFLAKSDKNMQIFVMDADGKNRKQVSNVENGVDGFSFSPDEKNVLIISQVKWGETAQDQYPDLDKTTGRIIDDLMYKHWDEWVEQIPHPFLATFDGEKVGEPIDIMEGEPYEAPMSRLPGHPTARNLCMFRERNPVWNTHYQQIPTCMNTILRQKRHAISQKE